MTWKIEVNSQVSKYLQKMDKNIQQITNGMNKIKALDNPRTIGKALQGKYVGFWRYRIGDFRIICELQDKKITILVIKVAHRKEVYK